MVTLSQTHVIVVRGHIRKPPLPPGPGHPVGKYGKLVHFASPLKSASPAKRKTAPAEPDRPPRGHRQKAIKTRLDERSEHGGWCPRPSGTRTTRRAQCAGRLGATIIAATKTFIVRACSKICTRCRAHVRFHSMRGSCRHSRSEHVLRVCIKRSFSEDHSMLFCTRYPRTPKEAQEGTQEGRAEAGRAHCLEPAAERLERLPGPLVVAEVVVSRSSSRINAQTSAPMHALDAQEAADHEVPTPAALLLGVL